MARGTTYGAVDSPAGTSTATKFAADGPARQIVGGPSISDVTIDSIFCSVYLSRPDLKPRPVLKPVSPF